MVNDDRLAKKKKKKTITFILACEECGESCGQGRDRTEIANDDENESGLTIL